MSKEKNEFLTRGCAYKPKPYQKNDNLYDNSCCKRNAYNWLEAYPMPDIYPKYPYVEVRFKNSRKDFFKLPENTEIIEGDVVAVEGNPGHEIGIVTLTGETARIQMKKKKVIPDQKEIKKLYRRARPADIEKWINVVAAEANSVNRTKTITTELGLSMKINDVEFQGDGTKAIFYYTADDRVDFRELIKILADQFNVRIEMKQIGARQEAGSLGGIGTCGRELCCASWMVDYKSVSTNSARAQQLSINPQKLAGQCSKLKCCLNFEYECYVDALKDFPKDDIILKTKKGEGFCQKTDVVKRLMWYSYREDPGNILAIPIEKVKMIIEKNKKGFFPEKLEDFTEVKEKKINFEHHEEELKKKSK